MSPECVDAVITWVDGYDPLHQAKLAKYLESQNLERPITAAPTRYNQQGEIEYCVKSILKFAPWIQTIYIVTDQQIPPIIQKLSDTSYEKKIILVDHRDIFSGFEHCLPTFNSVTIESLIWRIKGLSERFIYFNDDVILVRPVRYEDFFLGEELILRGRWKLSSDTKAYSYYKKIMGNTKPLNIHRKVQENSAKLAEIKHLFFHLPHVPFPIKKSTLETFFSQQPDILSANITYPLRSPHQFLPISLAHHLEIQQHTAMINNSLQGMGVDAGQYKIKKIQKKLKKIETNNKMAFVCMQSIDAAPAATQQYMLEWLNQWIS